MVWYWLDDWGVAACTVLEELWTLEAAELELASVETDPKIVKKIQSKIIMVHLSRMSQIMSIGTLGDSGPPIDNNNIVSSIHRVLLYSK